MNYIELSVSPKLELHLIQERNMRMACVPQQPLFNMKTLVKLDVMLCRLVGKQKIVVVFTLISHSVVNYSIVLIMITKKQST